MKARRTLGTALVMISLASCAVQFLSTPRQNGQLAFGRIRAVVKAESEYFKQNGEYGTLSDLASRLAAEEKQAFESGKLDGYQYEFDLAPAGFTIRATPLKAGKSGYWSYYADQSNKVRSRSDGRRAGPEDRPESPR